MMKITNPAEIASQKALNEMFAAIQQKKCFRLEAGAGAGKTYSLNKALKHLIEKKSIIYEKYGQQIACITFTNVAKDEIKEGTDNHPLIFTDTIHAFSWSILKGFQPTLRNLIPTLSEKWQSRINDAGGINTQRVIYDLGYPKADEMSIELHHDDVIKLMTNLLSHQKFRTLIKSKYPVIFIDEYQDTNKELANSIIQNIIENSTGVLVGLFGDHWQKIYGTNACGLIKSKQIVEIGKNANFRSDKNIVDCLNRIRPELLQEPVDPESNGEVLVFHSNKWTEPRRSDNHWQGDLPEIAAHEYLERTKEFLIRRGWSFTPEKTKVLMLTNNVLASEQRYRNLVNCFTDTDDYLKKNDYYLKYFFEVVEPMCNYFDQKKYGLMFTSANSKTPLLSCQKDKSTWNKDFEGLIELRKNGTIKEVLDLLKRTSHPSISSKVDNAENRFTKISDELKLKADIPDNDQNFFSKIENLHKVSYSEVVNLARYVDDKTPFSTKHGVKGAEFDNVLIIFGRGWNNYNWNQLLEWMKDGCIPAKQETYERNRNLFYVSCSRARKRMALLFTQELSSNALLQIEYLFGLENVIGEPNL